MMIPVRCFTCGRVLANSWESYSTRVKNGEEPADVMNDLGITRVCCRRMFVTHPVDPRANDAEPIDAVMKFD